MSVQTINLGNYANDGTGDDLRTAFTKVNANFALLDAEANINTASNVGSGAGIFKNTAAATIYLRTLKSNDGSVLFEESENEVSLQSITNLSTDSSPTLGANMSLGGYAITGPGDVQSTVFNYNIPSLHSMLALVLESNRINVDFGTFSEPTGFETEPNNRGYVVDMGLFIDNPPASNQYNFGTF